MYRHSMRCGLICLALACWPSRMHAAPLPDASRPLSACLAKTAQGIHLRLQPLFTLEASQGTETQTAARDFENTESRSQRATRINRNLLVATAAILTVFVIFRLLLHWQISRERKKMSQALLEGEL